MKRQSKTLFASISTNQLDHLTSVVNETLATGFNHPKDKIFTAADLWKIQRQGKTTINKRHFL